MKKILGLLSAILLSSNLMGQGLIITDQPVIGLPPHRIFPRPPRPIDRYLPIQVKRSDVETSIKGQIATTTISQTLYNPANRRVQGFFLFPIPNDARIDSFAMEIDGELTEGELLDSDKARKIYEDIVRRTLDPALFEYSEQNLFKVRIFPFESCSTKEIRIKYTQLLPKDGNLVNYTLPLKSREHCLTPDKKAAGKFNLEVSLDTPKDQRFRTIYSPSHDISVEFNDKKNKATVTLADKAASPVSDFQLVYSTAPSDKETPPLTTEFFTYYDKDKKDEGHFLVLVSPQVWNDAPLAPQPKDVVFVLDSSASMRDGKLDKAKEGLDFCLDSLNPDDRFQIVRFSTDSETLFKSLVPATKENLTRAGDFIKTIKAIGGTAVEEALSVAVDSLSATKNEDNRPRQIIFITDGKPTLGATDEKVLVKGVQRQLADAEVKARVFSFGIGAKINTHLLDLLARETKAHTQYALPTEDIEHKISRFYSKFAEPVFSDLSIDITGADWIRALTPKNIPDVFRGDQLVILGRFKKSNENGELTLSGNFRGKETTFTYPFSFAGGGKQNQFIPRLWAVRRVGWLLEQIRLNGESDELKDEVTSLAREYAIVTPYTSWLILEDEAKRGVPVTNRSLREFDATPMARRELRTKADAFAYEKSGDEALAAAASEADFKSASNIAAQSRAMKRSNYSAAAPAPGAVQIEPETQLINGKTFYRNSDQWVDSDSQALGKDTPVRQIKFGTDEYFTFLRNNPQASQWFSAGNNLRLAFSEKEIIEIIN
ncbi:MAG: VIT and VWA domain-containing protein [Verrucomicrobiales bacterium]|nr:VIT and VWA domain-containing protein [Verrucomicrobiales bacterium]